MPKTRSLAWSELKIGIVAVAAIGLAIMIIIAVGGQGGFSWERYTLLTKFPDVAGLKSGAVVRVAGVEVGKVTEVELVGSEVQVVLSVNEDNQSRITTESRASIGSLSLLGEPVIDITPSTQGTPLKDGDFIPAARAKGQLADVAAGASQALDQATELLRDIRAGKGSVGKLFTDDQLYREINSFVESAEAVAGGLRRGEGTIGAMIRNRQAYDRMNASLGNLQEMTRRVNAGEGSLGKFLKDDTLAKNITSASGNFDRVSARLTQSDNTMGKLLNEKELYDRFNTLTGRIDKLIDALGQGQGTAGQLMQNKELYDNMNKAARELNELIAAIKADPKKYLNVRVSIF